MVLNNWFDSQNYPTGVGVRKNHEIMGPRLCETLSESPNTGNNKVSLLLCEWWISFYIKNIHSIEFIASTTSLRIVYVSCKSKFCLSIYLKNSYLWSSLFQYRNVLSSKHLVLNKSQFILRLMETCYTKRAMRRGDNRREEGLVKVTGTIEVNNMRYIHWYPFSWILTYLWKNIGANGGR